MKTSTLKDSKDNKQKQTPVKVVLMADSVRETQYG
jgi:hypothetical protein